MRCKPAQGRSPGSIWNSGCCQQIKTVYACAWRESDKQPRVSLRSLEPTEEFADEDEIPALLLTQPPGSVGLGPRPDGLGDTSTLHSAARPMPPAQVNDGRASFFSPHPWQRAEGRFQRQSRMPSRASPVLPPGPPRSEMRGQADGTLQKPFTWKREDGELCPSDKMGSKAHREGEPTCSEHRARKGEGPIRAPKTTSLQGPAWEGGSREAHGKRTKRCVTETKVSSRCREQVSVLTAAERLRRMKAPQHCPGGSPRQDLGKESPKPHTGTLLTSSVMGP